MKGIIFDMDGTIWDSAKNVAKSWDDVVCRIHPGLRRITTEDIQNVMGRTMTEISRILFPMLSEEEADELLEVCCREENEYLRQHGAFLYPDLEETLRELGAEYPLYIVSNCQKGYIEAFLSYYGFEKYFQDIECFGNTGEGKAHNIREIVQRNHLQAAVYVGDIEADYTASTQAGIPFIHAAYGFGTIADPVPAIQSLKELPQAVKFIFSQKKETA